MTGPGVAIWRNESRSGDPLPVAYDVRVECDHQGFTLTVIDGLGIGERKVLVDTIGMFINMVPQRCWCARLLFRAEQRN